MICLKQWFSRAISAHQMAYYIACAVDKTLLNNIGVSNLKRFFLWYFQAMPVFTLHVIPIVCLCWSNSLRNDTVSQIRTQPLFWYSGRLRGAHPSHSCANHTFTSPEYIVTNLLLLYIHTSKERGDKQTSLYIVRITISDYFYFQTDTLIFLYPFSF